LELEKETQPLISVVIPLYNAEKYISETIESVIHQTYQNWEMIIVDDCSNDRSRIIVKEYKKKDCRIKLIESESNFGGPARPRNIGIDNAKGEFVAFLDADDLWMEDKLNVQVELMIANNLDFTSTKEKKIDNKNLYLKNTKKENILNFITKKHNFNAILLHNFIVNSSVMIKRDIIFQLKFDEDKMLIAIEDYYLWIELFLNDKKYKYIDNTLVSYRILENSAVQRTNKMKNQARRNYALSKLCMKYQSNILLKNIYKLNTIKYIKSFINK